jgi:hypothetical protein
VQLPATVVYGFTGGTGNLMDVHDVSDVDIAY